MANRTLHLSAYKCENCANPVVAGSLVDLENTVEFIGAVCLHCGRKQENVPQAGSAIQFEAKDWD
jgi:hypothetical protein